MPNDRERNLAMIHIAVLAGEIGYSQEQILYLVKNRLFPDPVYSHAVGGFLWFRGQIDEWKKEQVAQVEEWLDPLTTADRTDRPA